MSKHGRTRCQQRGITNDTIAMLWEHWDRVSPVGRGLVAMTLTRGGAARLRRAGVPPAKLERLVGKAMVVSPDGVIVTVLHADHRRYRRGSN